MILLLVENDTYMQIHFLRSVLRRDVVVLNDSPGPPPPPPRPLLFRSSLRVPHLLSLLSLLPLLISVYLLSRLQAYTTCPRPSLSPPLTPPLPLPPPPSQSLTTSYNYSCIMSATQWNEMSTWCNGQWLLAIYTFKIPSQVVAFPSRRDVTSPFACPDIRFTFELHLDNIALPISVLINSTGR